MRNFIVIDNDDQDSEIENVSAKARQDGFQVNGFWFDPTTSECLTMIEGELLIDKIKVISELERIYNDKSIDLILLDFKLSDDATDGVDLALYIRTNWRRGKVPLIMYSGDYDQLMDKLSIEWHPEKFTGDFKSQFKVMKDYFKNFPDDTFKREKGFSDVLVEYLKTIPINMEKILLDKLKEYPEEMFRNIHPMFNGKKLKEIAKSIEDKTGNSEVFKLELIERSIAHYINLED